MRAGGALGRGAGGVRPCARGRGVPLLAALGLALAVALPAHVASAEIVKRVEPDGTVSYTIRGGKRGGRKASKRPEGAPLPSPPRDRSAERFTRYDRHIERAAALYRIPEALIRAVMKVESDFDPRAVSHAGAQGLMQLMPATAFRMGVVDPFDPRENILGGTRYLRVLANYFHGNLELTVAAYNAGEEAVMRHGGIPPYEETRNYVVQVLTHYRRYRTQPDALAAARGG